MTKTNDFELSGFFALRTPLRPFETLLSWAEGLSAVSQQGAGNEALGAALAADRKVLRERLRTLVASPEVREAVFVASPSLDESLAHWERDPEGERGQKVERSLVRYVERLAGRPTPFGLFAGCSVGTFGETSRLELAERARYERHTRLDMDYVYALAEALAKDPAIRRTLPHRPNSSLYTLGPQLRYVEGRLAGKSRTYHLVAVEATEYLSETLRSAEAGAEPRVLAEKLAVFAEVELDEANAFIEELIDSQLLVPALSPQVTGSEPIHTMVELLRQAEAGASVAATLEAAQGSIEALDRGGLGHASEAYRAIAKSLESLPAPVELPRLFQVDMVKPKTIASLGPLVAEELERGLEVLRRLTPAPSSRDLTESSLGRFRTAFRERYEELEVPLVWVLDEDGGIGFDKTSEIGAEGSPLLEGLPLGGGRGGDSLISFRARERHLLRRLVEHEKSGGGELVLTDADLKAMESTGDKPPMPDAFSLMATLAAASPEALAAGDFQILLRGASGPSGANLLGRFCHGDPELLAHVREHIRAEEALRPDAIFAEVVHLPEGRIGNVLARPVLRSWELPFLGRSGAAQAEQLALDDLLVSVRGDRVVLRSRRLGREVLPRLTTAHNFSSPRNLGAYRFLCAVQSQGTLGAYGLSWGPLEALESLPRVRYGKLVLARARWRLGRERLAGVTKGKGAERFAAMQRLRAELAWPRFIEVADYDNELPIDLDNVLSIETFAHLVKDRFEVELVEMWPEPTQLCVTGPEGRFTHELVLPYVKKAPEAPAVVASKTDAPPTKEGFTRRFAPGSSWLYAKIYLGPGQGDRVLREAITPVVAQALGSGAAQSWFFIRYGDPGWHLRVRFAGEPTRLTTEVAPALHAALAPLLDSGTIFRVVMDTYDREVERYGGPQGMLLAEQLFAADSDLVLALVGLFEGDAAADARWRLALYGMDALLGDLGFDLNGKLEVVRRARTSFGREFGIATFGERVLGDKFRKQRASLEALLDPARNLETEFAPALPLFAQRSKALAKVGAALRDPQTGLADSLESLSTSYLHMHANRILRSAARPQELVLYDFLVRLYESRLARARRGG